MEIGCSEGLTLNARLNEAAIRLIKSWFKHTMKPDIISLLIKRTATIWMHQVDGYCPNLYPFKDKNAIKD